MLVVVPAFNEEVALPGVLKELREETPDLDILVVDDGSSDGTSAVAHRAGVAVATLPYNLGIGGAVRTGMRYALEHDYDALVQVDADGQHRPDQIGALLAALDAGADMAIGSRFAEDDSYVVSPVRSGAMSVLRIAVRLLSGRRFTDTSSGFKAFNANTMRFFARSYPTGYLSDAVEALLIASYGGLEVAEVPVEMRVRAGGKPSTRNIGLAVHFAKVMVSIATTAHRRSRRVRESR